MGYQLKWRGDTNSPQGRRVNQLIITDALFDLYYDVRPYPGVEHWDDPGTVFVYESPKLGVLVRDEDFFIQKYIFTWFYQWGVRAPTEEEMVEYRGRVARHPDIDMRFLPYGMTPVFEAIRDYFTAHPTPPENQQTLREAIEAVWEFFPDYPAPPFPELPKYPEWDVNQDGIVDILDLVHVARHFGRAVPEEGASWDVNGDGQVNIIDLVLVGRHFGESYIDAQAAPVLSGTEYAGDLEKWIQMAKDALESSPELGTSEYMEGLASLEGLLGRMTLTPDRTALLQNFPNPFNPETWLPYQLDEDSEVSITVYNMAGHQVRSLHLGRRKAGLYLDRSRAAYWDGRNDAGERVSSGTYLIELQTEDESLIRKAILVK